MPSHCLPSLQLCSRVGSGHRLLGVCHLGSLRCLGGTFTLASDADCDWPEETFRSCEDCRPGTICQESLQRCTCQSPSECPKDSAPLCVRSGPDGAEVTMSECEVGARRCAGQNLHVTSVDACPV